jgi:membrane protease YdiL (CAAX protease family)
LSSSDNPQFEQQPLVSAEVQSSSPIALDPVAAGTLPPIPTAPRDPVWSGWDVLLIAGLTLVTMFVLQSVVTLTAYYVTHPRVPFTEILQRPILLMLSQLLVYVAVFAFMKLLVEGKYRVPFWQSIRWNWPTSEWRLLGLGALMLFGLDILQSFLPIPKDTPFEHLFDRPLDAYLLSIIAVSLGPLMEELFFRGFLYPVLARRMGVAWGIFLTALPFGLIHLPQYGGISAWGVGLVILLVGVVCGIVRAATGSVGASFLVHVGYNGMQMLIAVVATQGFRHMPKALACSFLL